MEMSTQSCTPQYLRCLKCMKIIRCSRYDTSCLVRHVQKEHPEIIEDANEKVLNLHKLAAEHGISEERLTEISKMTGMSEMQMADEADRYIQKKNNHSPTQSLGGKDLSKDHSKAPKHLRISDSKDLNRRQFYRSSIERWIPTDGCIYCPKCCTNSPPLIKSSAEFHGGAGCSSACISNCWPFCFLPCLNSGDNREYLHCCNCKCFLGIYDRENNCIRPNREFVCS